MDAGTFEDAWLSADGGGYHNEVDAGLGLQRLLRFREPLSYPLYSLAELIDGDIPDNAIKDRIVLIGSTAPSLRDLFNVPHTRFRREQEVFQVSGVEIHANRVATLLDHRNNKLAIGWIMPGWGNLLLVAFCMALGLLLGERLPTLRRSVIAVVRLSVATAGGITVLLWNHIWIGIALPLTGLLSMGGASWLRRGAMSQQHAQQIRDLLGQTTSPAVAQQLWDQRDELLSNGPAETLDIALLDADQGDRRVLAGCRRALTGDQVVKDQIDGLGQTCAAQQHKHQHSCGVRPDASQQFPEALHPCR